MPKIGMKKIKPEELKQKLQRTGLPRQELAHRLGVKTPSIFFKWLTNGKIPADRLTTLNQIIDEASGSAKRQRNDSPFNVGTTASISGLAHIPDKILIEELQRRLDAVSNKGKG